MKPQFLKKFCLALGLLIAAGAWTAAFSAPGIDLTGVVMDENGEALPGASVVVQGTTQGTITDIDGKFAINAPEGAVLEVSFIGYNSARVVVGKSNVLEITLEPDTKLLDEVVVIGYGTVKKKDLTGAVSAVKGDVLEARKTTALSNALQGSVAGLMVTRDNSAPGSSASSIRVRGITTIGDSNPLIIVDGVPCSSIDYVNSSDVASVSVLKDAAAASIYGSKAASGVILITTKRGGQDAKMSLTYTGEFGLEVPTDEPDMVGVTRYLEMYNELLYNDNPSAGFFQQYSADQVKNWVKYNQTDPNHYPITDWRGMMMNSYAPRQSHQISVSGGNSAVRSKVSFSYDDVSALYDGRRFQRYMVRSNTDFVIIKDKLNASLDFNVRRGKNLRPIYDPFSDMRKMPAVYAAVWEDGRYAEGKSGANPYALLLTGGTSTSWSTQVAGKGSIEYKPFKGLSIQAIVSPFINYTKQKSMRYATYYTAMDDPDVIGGYLEGGGSSYNTNKLTENRNDNYNVTTQLIANYHNTFGEKHNFSAMAGFENYVMKSESLSASADNLELSQYPYLSMGTADYMTNGGSANEYTSNSVFGRLMYDYDGRYLLQANVRHDGSSRFARKYRWGTFPSVSAGWVVSKEPFMAATSGWLSFLKLRASWGQLGNERIGDNYFPYMSLMTFGTALFYNGSDVEASKTAAIRTLAVEDITWETTTSTDLGLDMNFFKNRLTFSGDYYWKTTDDMLLSIEIPYTMGYSNPKTNAGKMATHGYDLELGWNDRKGDFSYNVTMNFSDFLSRIVSLNNADIISGSHIQREGELYNAWYGYISDGIYQTQEEVDNSAKTATTVTVGDIKYRDVAGAFDEDGNPIPDGKINSDDKVVLGNALPRYQFGGTFNCNWKGFDFGLAWQGIGKKDAYISSVMVQPLRDNYGNIPAILDDNYWSPFNTAEQNAAAKYPRLTKVGISNNYATSSYWLFNGAYFRLKNVTLGYTIPESLTNRVKMSRVRVYISASDLFCISNYPQGWDPEMGTTSYPITTSVLGGVSIKF